MANVFDKIGDIRNDVHRSSFDWSHANNVTTGIGRITPIFCEEVPPNSSLKINANMGLQFMPMMYPVQTRMKVVTSFFKVPLRTLWKNYMNWISSPNTNASNADYVPPFINGTDKSYFNNVSGLFRVSGLADYLGVPVTVDLPPFSLLPATSTFDPKAQKCAHPVNGSELEEVGLTSANCPAQPSYKLVGSSYDYADGWAVVPLGLVGDTSTDVKSATLTFKMVGSRDKVQKFYDYVSAVDGEQPVAFLSVAGTLTMKVANFAYAYAKNVKFTIVDDSVGQSFFEFTISISAGVGMPYMSLGLPNCTLCVNAKTTAADTTLLFDKSFVAVNGGAVAIDASTCPYYGGSNKDSNAIKLSAFPFRAYEAIYNAYIRNIKNNPFKKNGKAVYNEWITNDGDGADSTPYDLFRANWYSDQFTTALPSPQQGTAPLVGLTTYTSTNMDENGHQISTLNYALVDEDGKRYKVEFESNDDALKGVKYTELGNDVALAPYSLVNSVTSGISINDLRNVNAYQRYLELNQFRGYSYKDIIEGRFDVNVKYDALQMPEYIGGFTRDINMNAVTQTTETSSNGSYSGALGSQSGLAFVNGRSENISVFCDESCIVMGIMYVVPIPVYTQCLPKFFTYRDRLDYFAPEFDHIGYQPIAKQELTPIQQWIKDKTKMMDTFGYNRPWYQYCQKLDVAHGIFRTELKNFFINRVFDSTPELGASFTTIDENDVNDVFSVTETTDKIFGQIYFDVEARLPISRVVVPRLE